MRFRSPSKSLKFSHLLFFLAVILVFSSCGGLPAEHERVKAKDGEIRIPITGVNDGKVHFFTYKKSGKKINFFVRKDRRGELSTYFDACFTCQKFKKGYREEGTDIICNECSMKFSLADEKWSNKDGCSPIMLKSTIVNGVIIIKTEHIERGAKLF